MAMKSDSSGGGGGKVLYDPLYSSGHLQNNNSKKAEDRKLFDDFSVANHVHFMRPQLVSVNTKILVEKQQNKESKRVESKE